MARHRGSEEFNPRVTDVTGLLRTVQRNAARFMKNHDSQARSCQKCQAILEAS